MPLLPAAAERVSESKHDDFGDGDALDQQEGAIGAEDPQRALDLAPPVKREFGGDDFDELKICVRSRREKGRVPPPGRDDNGESADERSALECAAAGRSPNEYHVSLHDWPTVGPRVSARPVAGHAPLDLGDGKRETPSLYVITVYRIERGHRRLLLPASRPRTRVRRRPARPAGEISRIGDDDAIRVSGRSERPRFKDAGFGTGAGCGSASRHARAFFVNDGLTER